MFNFFKSKQPEKVEELHISKLDSNKQKQKINDWLSSLNGPNGGRLYVVKDDKIIDNQFIVYEKGGQELGNIIISVIDKNSLEGDLMESTKKQCEGILDNWKDEKEKSAE